MDILITAFLLIIVFTVLYRRHSKPTTGIKSEKHELASKLESTLEKLNVFEEDAELKSSDEQQLLKSQVAGKKLAIENTLNKIEMDGSRNWGYRKLQAERTIEAAQDLLQNRLLQKQTDQPMNSDQKLAILIDGDNIPAKYVNEMLQETTKYGTPTIKRIYGDWTNPRLNKWKGILLDNAITPIQQYAYTIGKNATDSAMIIDAMDILYSGKVDGFCLVSSDSDFTRLATRLREAGMTVIGIGEKKTPEPFLAACNRFVYLEILQSQENEEEETNGAKPKKRKTKGKQNIEKLSKKDIQFIAATISDVAADDGWAFMGDVGSMLQKKRPSFDSRNYGFQKLTPLINSAERFEIEQRENHGDRFKLIYVRDKQSAIK